LDTAATGAFATSPRAPLNAPLKKEPLGSFEGAESLSLAFGSALNVEPRTKLPEPKPSDGLSSSFFIAPPKVFPNPRGELEPKVENGAEAGLAPKTLPPEPVAAAAAAKPPV
jgi:hypothetical protein